jgi:hypothetical protein
MTPPTRSCRRIWNVLSRCRLLEAAWAARLGRRSGEGDARCDERRTHRGHVVGDAGCRSGWSRSSRRRPPIDLSMVAFARGACGGLRRIRIRAAVNTASNAAVNFGSRSRSTNLTEWTRSSRSINTLRAICVTYTLPGWSVTPRIRIGGSVRNDGQHVGAGPVEQVDREEISGENRLGSAAHKLLLRRACSSRRRWDPAWSRSPPPSPVRPVTPRLASSP